MSYKDHDHIDLFQKYPKPVLHHIILFRRFIRKNVFVIRNDAKIRQKALRSPGGESRIFELRCPGSIPWM